MSCRDLTCSRYNTRIAVPVIVTRGIRPNLSCSLESCVMIRCFNSLSPMTWWRHQMETFSALLALCAGNSPVPVNSPHKGQWRGALVFSLICAWINGWENNGEAGDLIRHRAHYDVTVMMRQWTWFTSVQVVDGRIVGAKPLLKQCLTDWPFGNELLWNLIQCTETFIAEIAFQKVVCRLSTILFRGQLLAWLCLTKIFETRAPNLHRCDVCSNEWFLKFVESSK